MSWDLEAGPEKIIPNPMEKNQAVREIPDVHNQEQENKETRGRPKGKIVLNHRRP